MWRSPWNPHHHLSFSTCVSSQSDSIKLEFESKCMHAKEVFCCCFRKKVKILKECTNVYEDFYYNQDSESDSDSSQESPAPLGLHVSHLAIRNSHYRAGTIPQPAPQQKENKSTFRQKYGIICI